MPDSPPSLDPQLLVAHSAFMRALAGALLRDPNDADDVAQQACLDALRRPPRRAGPLAPWLATVVSNLARKLRRGALRRTRWERSAAVSETVEPGLHVLERAEALAALARAVATLEQPYRSTLLLRYFDGLPVAEVARQSGVPLETARTRLRRALARLRVLMAPHDNSPAQGLAILVAPHLGRAGTVPALTATKGGILMGASTKIVATAAAVALAWFAIGRLGDPAPREGTEPGEARRDAPSLASPGLGLGSAPGPRSAATAGAPAHVPRDSSPDTRPEPAAAPLRVGHGTISGRVKLPEGELTRGWRVVWRRTPMEPRVGAGDVREDGSFDVPVPAHGDSYALWLRPASALWPTELGLERALVGGATGELVLEPEPLSAFRVRVVALPPPVGPIPVQVTSYAPDVPNLVLALPPGESALKVEGREDGVLYGVYVGPTSDGRCGFWQGRPRSDEEISVTLLVGGRLTGYVEAREQPTPGSLRVFMHALTGADVEAVVDADGRFDQGGLSKASLWRVEARALTRSGRAVVSEAQVKPVDSEVVLRWGATPR